MATYTYKIRKDKSVITGTLQASSQTEARISLRKLGGVPLDLKEKPEKKDLSIPFLKPGLSLKEKIIFTEQLSVMLNAGITLVQALHGLGEETTNKTMKKIITDLMADVEGGMPFSQALAKQPRYFTTIFCQMIRSAEQTGNLAEILSKLTDQQQKEYELKGKVRGALMYPAIISVLLICVIIMVITFIIPKLSGLFSESGATLPASTRLLLAVSSFFTHEWYILVAIVIGLIVGSKYFLATKKGRYIWDSFKIHIPVLGSFIRKSYMARFAQNFASLAQAGVPVLEVFQTLGGVIGNVVYEEEITKIAHDVENGIKVSVAIRKSKYFPAMVGQLVSVGEQSGDLAGVFKVLGDFFEKEVDTMAKNLSTMLEPIIMIIMGVVVGFILVAVLQPIYSLTNAV